MLECEQPFSNPANYFGERLFGCAATMLAGLRLADPQLRVLAASPMDRQDHLACCLVDIGNDVGDQGAQEPLAYAHRRHSLRGTEGSNPLPSSGESGENRAVPGGQWRV